MATDDHAIVIAISRYPHIDDLEGPEHDAEAVIAWLQDPQGGGVPRGQVHRVTSAAFAAQDPRPGSDDVYDAFGPLLELGEQDDTRPVARRLYIFMAGHGFGPTIDEASLLMANARRGSYGHNVSGRKVADHFAEARYFREIVLLMDCCREKLRGVQAALVPWQPAQGEGDAPRRLYGYAVSDSVRAREAPNGEVTRGFFTLALIDALRAGARNSSELRDLVRKRMIALMDPDDYHRPEFFIPDDEDEVEFGLPPQLLALTVTLAAAEGQVRVTVERNPGEPLAADTELSAGGTIVTQVEFGAYRVVRHDTGEETTVQLETEDVHAEI